tara:strand:+ start:168 stop:1799 length:1632 start_codon:yes stop_codon:yes gene_type:complete
MIKNKKYIYYILSISSIFVYRYYWSTVSQWREDQSTNIWLAYTKNISDMPVGLLSSKMVPNPNGIIIYGKILTIFESLLAATFFLSIIQIFIFYFLSRELTDNFKVNNYAFAVLSMSTLMSSSSVEFWNNWVLIFINAFFFIFILKFINTQKSEYLFISLLISFIPPALYLAGITNFIVYSFIILLSVIINGKPKAVSRKGFIYISSIVFILINYFLIWNPYFNSTTFQEIFGFSNLTLYDRFNLLTDSVLQLPGSFLSIWTFQKSFHILQADMDVISELTHTLFKLYVEYHKILFLIFFIFIIFGSISLTKIKNKDVNILLIKKIFLFITFVSSSVLLNPVLGGPNYLLLERMENMAQYYIFYILVCFLFPFVFIEFKLFHKRLIPLSQAVFILFIFLNITLSVNLISNSLNYDGDKLTEADVPLVYKIELVDFIGKDSESKPNIEDISISYFLGGGIWDWIPNHSEYFSKWYPDYPFTIGRAYDYQLLKKYSIKNSYEGLNSRNFKNSDYIVTYKFDQHEVIGDENYTHHYFGQLRLSVKK